MIPSASKLQSAHRVTPSGAPDLARQLAGAPGLFYSNPAVTSNGGAHEVAITSETSDAVHNEWTIAAGASPNVPAALKG